MVNPTSDARGLTLGWLSERVGTDAGYLPNGRADGTNRESWLAFLRAVAAEGWALTHLSTDPATPESPEALLGVDTAVTVTIGGRVHLNLFPAWGLDSIWFDFDMHEMNAQAEVDLLAHFVTLLASVVGRPVLLTLEGADDLAVATYDPETQLFR